MDELIENGTISKQNVELKKNHVFCDKCGSNVEIGKGYCKHCMHILSEEIFVKNMKQKMLDMKAELERDEIIKNTRGLRFACLCVPLLGLILKFVYMKSNPILADLCFDSWLTGLGKIRLLIILLVAALIFWIF